MIGVERQGHAVVPGERHVREEVGEFEAGAGVESLETINKELELYNPELGKKIQVVIGTKVDSAVTKEMLDRMEKYCKIEKTEFFPISAVTGKGIKSLLSYLSSKLEVLRGKH